MPQEQLGYVELEWTCKNCGTRNPGTRKTCSNCGAAMSAKDEFELPAQQELIQDPEKLKAAEQGPDITCPFCGTRNPAGATSCKQCGGDLTGAQARLKGGVLGAFDTTAKAEVKCQNCGTLNPATALKCSNCGASLQKPQPKTPAPAPAATRAGGMNPLLIGGIILAVLVVCVGAFYLLGRTSDVVGTVAGVSWQRSIALMAQVPVRDADWQNNVPSDATITGCELKPRRFSDQPEPNSEKVCGTPYVVDQGSGVGKVVQDCQYRVSEQYCSFTRLQWRVTDTVSARGTDLNANWPSLALQSGQREGNRAEEYRVTFDASGKRYEYSPKDAADFGRYKPGSRWTLKVNSLGSVTDTTPVP